jgi:hypothetical protein
MSLSDLPSPRDAYPLALAGWPVLRKSRSQAADPDHHTAAAYPEAG